MCWFAQLFSLGSTISLVWRTQKAEKASAETFKPAFTVPSSDIAALTVTRPAKPDQPAIHLERVSGSWKVSQPVDTAADGSVVDTSVDNLTSARITQTEPYSSDRLKAFGLDPPQRSPWNFRLKNGAKHTLLIGDKVFDGSSVYAIIDGAKSVSVLPDSVSTSTDKSLDDWRDHAVLHITSNQVPSFTLKNPSGEMALTKTKDQWNFTKPTETRADQDSIDALLTAIQNAKFTNVASEKPEDLAKYGLANPAVSITTSDDTGKEIHPDRREERRKRLFRAGYFAADDFSRELRSLHAADEKFRRPARQKSCCISMQRTSIASRFTTIMARWSRAKAATIGRSSLRTRKKGKMLHSTSLWTPFPACAQTR